MSLEKCPECSTDVSSTANACPKCGFDLKKERTKQKTAKNAKGCAIGCLSIIIFMVVISMLSSGKASNSASETNSSDKLQARIDSISIIPFVNNKGERHQLILFHWTNVGTEPIGSLWADISAYDKNSVLIFSEENDCIFSAPSSEKIPPGKSFVATEGNGSKVIFPGVINGRTDINIWKAKPKAKQGKAIITKVEAVGYDG